MNTWLELREVGLNVAAVMLGIAIIYWIIYEIRDTAFQNGYWKGRADGWNMHRRMIDNKVKSDEVFDYDKN